MVKLNSVWIMQTCAIWAATCVPDHSPQTITFAVGQPFHSWEFICEIDKIRHFETNFQMLQVGFEKQSWY